MKNSATFILLISLLITLTGVGLLVGSVDINFNYFIDFVVNFN